MSGGGSSGGSQTTTNRPFPGQEAALNNLFSRADKLYDNDQLYRISPQSQYTTQAQDLIANRALGPNLADQASGVAGDVLGGQYMNPESNPYLSSYIDQAQQRTIDNFNEQVAPNIDAQFSAGGALGSGAYAAARNRAEDTLTDSLSDTAGRISFDNYNQERGRQQQTLGLAPFLDQAGYAGADRLAGVGADQDAYSQALYDRPFQSLNRYSNLVQGGGLNFGTQTATSKRPDADPFSMALGVAGLGASIFCDERLKTDIVRIGSFNNGIPVYSFRYYFDPPGRRRFGPMAQEVRKLVPKAVGEVAGYLTVDLKKLEAAHV